MLINILELDRKLEHLATDPDHLIALTDYMLHRSAVINQYKQMLAQPVRVRITASGMLEEPIDLTPHVNAFMKFVSSTVPFHTLRRILPQDVPGLTCMFCGSAVDGSTCTECAHVQSAEFNNSYLDIDRINIYRNNTLSTYRDDICVRTLEEAEGKCTTSIPIHVMVDIAQQLYPTMCIHEAMITDIHTHAYLFETLHKEQIYRLVTKMPTMQRYRLVYQVNYVYNFLTNRPCKNFQQYRPRLLRDIHEFDDMFFILYSGKHALNAQYLIYVKLQEYGVQCSLEDFHPLCYNRKKPQYDAVYAEVTAAMK